MNTHNNIAFRVGLVGAVVFSFTVAVHAGERFRSGWYSASRGRAGTFQQQISRQPGQYSRDTTVQTASGHTANRNVTDTWNRQAGTADRSVATTGPNGRTSTVNESVAHSGDTTTINGSRTGFDGRTSSWSKTVTAGGGTATVNREYTRQNGNTISASASAAKTADGREVSASYESSTGKNGSYSAEVTHDDGVRTKTQEVTGPREQSFQRIIETTPDGTTIVRTATP